MVETLSTLWDLIGFDATRIRGGLPSCDALLSGVTLGLARRVRQSPLADSSSLSCLACQDREERGGAQCVWWE